ncbi:MAG: class I SAM-dependent methyltransferase [Flavobacterium sp.]|nr:class I SAM-dependent methyltransferase [Flavobacterium sp.]
MDVVKYNSTAWDGYVDKRDKWTIPVSDHQIADARKGAWNVVLTPLKPVPHEWFGDLTGKKILGLASGGGQQGPILAAAGAHVTIFDNSAKQLQQDKTLSDRHSLEIETIQGDMRNLSVFDNASFDIIFNPCSILFAENVIPIWRECYRVLKPGGILMTGLINPISLQLEKSQSAFKLEYKQPYSDQSSLPTEKFQTLLNENEPLIFGHSLTDQIGGQLKAGFAVTDMFEDVSGDDPLDDFFPSFIATRSVKF